MDSIVADKDMCTGGKLFAHVCVAPRLISGQDSFESPHWSFEVCEQC